MCAGDVVAIWHFDLDWIGIDPDVVDFGAVDGSVMLVGSCVGDIMDWDGEGT